MIAGSPPRPAPKRYRATMVLVAMLGQAMGAEPPAVTAADGDRITADDRTSAERRTERAPAAAPPPARTTGNGGASTGGTLDAARVERETEAILARLLPPRSDAALDWGAGSSCLHAPGDPRWLTPCVPGPPCDPSLPPHPFDLVGIRGAPTGGPIYAGPCAPRTGSHDCGPAPRLHRVHDWMFDRFYRAK